MLYRCTQPGCGFVLRSDDDAVRRLTAADLLDAIDALHQPFHPDPDNFPSYTECEGCLRITGITWPCPTARLLHPEAPDE